MAKSIFKIYIIGTGQIGSRHLQALKKVRAPLAITAIDPSSQSLIIAEQRYKEMAAGRYVHPVSFLPQLPSGQKIDLAIIATTADIRAQAIKDLLTKNGVRYLILEKLLFDKKNDYQAMGKIIAKLKIKAWVNCPLRLRPIYQKIKKGLTGENVSFRLTGSRLGLATDTIHYLDFVAYLIGSHNFKVNTNLLDQKTVPSKRKGFLELNGTLDINFGQEARCELTSYASGDSPPLIEIFDQQTRYIFSNQFSGPGKERSGWISQAKNGWQWEKIKFNTPLISETTTAIVEDIIKNGCCNLTPYQESSKIHLALLEPLRLFLNKNSGKKYDYYPFT